MHVQETEYGEKDKEKKKEINRNSIYQVKRKKNCMAVENWWFLNWRLQIFNMPTKENILVQEQDYWNVWVQEAQAT